MRCGSICAGIAGIDLAFDRQGFETVWYSEIDPNCNKLLAVKLPNAKAYGDLAQFKPDPGRDRVDVIFGGTPCQDLSVAGKRAGLDGERSGLFFQMVRVCKRLRPSLVVWENVPGAFSSNDGRDFQAVIRAFTGLKVEVPGDGWGNAGFVRTPFPLCRWHVAWRVLDAQYCGVPQRRRRIVLVASLGDARCAEILFEPESVRGDSAPSRKAGQRVAGSLSARTEGGGGLGTDFEAGGGACRKHSRPKATSSTETTAKPTLSEHSAPERIRGGGNGQDAYTGHIIADCNGPRTGGAEVMTDGSPTLNCNHEAPIVFQPRFYTRDNKTGGQADSVHPPLTAAQERSRGDAVTAIAFTERTRKDGRNFECQEEQAYALTNPGLGGRTHSRSIAVAATVRRLTPTECERLQGLPDGHTKGFSDSVRYRMIGNSVAVPVFEWVAARIKAISNPTHDQG